MSPTETVDPQSLVRSWLITAEPDHPAGPLFTNRFTQAELSTGGALRSTEVTGSHTVLCC